MTLDELYAYACERGMEIDDHHMREIVSASFPEGWIAIDTGKLTKTEEKATLAHEIGHCETGSFYNIHSSLDVRSKHERRADVFAFKLLVPEEELLAAVGEGVTEIWELAERFDVPCEFMARAVEYWREKGAA